MIYDELLKQKDIIGCDNTIVDYEDLIAAYPIVEHKNNYYLAIKPDTEDDILVEWALFEFYMSNTDGSETQLKSVCRGCGTGGSLREMRHTWFDSDGYAFCFPAKAFIWTIDKLKDYFDFD